MDNIRLRCPNHGFGPGGGANVTPHIDSISPNIVTVGSNIAQVTIAGGGFGSAPTVNLPAGVTVLGGQGSSNTEIILNNVAISINATIGPNSITVTARGTDGTNQTSNQGAFTLDGPFYMTVYSDVLGHCSGCTTTVARFVTYQVRNLTNSLATNIPIGENVTTSGWNCQQTDPGNATTPCSAGTRTGAAAEFTDEWALSSDSFTPVGCGDNVDGHWLWCPTGRSIGHLSGYVHTNAVKINGVVSPPNTFAQGTIINP